MPRQYIHECVIELPDDPHEMSEIISRTKEPYNALADALKASGVKFQLKSEIRVKYPRKHTGTVAGLVAVPPPEAAE